MIDSTLFWIGQNTIVTALLIMAVWATCSFLRIDRLGDMCFGLLY